MPHQRVHKDIEFFIQCNIILIVTVRYVFFDFATADELFLSADF